jgi:hypothetical protein
MQHVIKKKKKRGLWPKLTIRQGQDSESWLAELKHPQMKQRLECR